MAVYPLSDFCFKQTRAVCSTFHYDGLLWHPVWLHHSHSSNCYLTRLCIPLITFLHVTVVVSFNLLWGQFGNKSSVFCSFHTECRLSGSGSPKSMCVTHKHQILYISMSESMYMCTLYHSFKFNTALLPLLWTLHVWVVQQNLVWTGFLADFHVCDCDDIFSCTTVSLLYIWTSPEVRRSLSSTKFWF